MKTVWRKKQLFTKIKNCMLLRLRRLSKHFYHTKNTKNTKHMTINSNCKTSLDFRSDTGNLFYISTCFADKLQYFLVTLPTQDMLQSLTNLSVGDDVFQVCFNYFIILKKCVFRTRKMKLSINYKNIWLI